MSHAGISVQVEVELVEQPGLLLAALRIGDQVKHLTELSLVGYLVR